MVSHDPSEGGQKVEHSKVWVIRKQQRRKKVGAEDEITALSSYFVIGENVYMAPTVGSILSSRLVISLSTVYPPYTDKLLLARYRILPQ